MKTILIPALAAFALSAPLAYAQDQVQERVQTETQTQTQQLKRGTDLMSPQERAEHKKTMREKETVQEREQYREEKHEEMKERAKEQGVSIPDKPLPQGSGGMMQGPRDGSGYGPGKGTGGR